MQTLKVEANFRSDMSKSRIKQIRRDGYVTGSIFGRDSEPVSIELNLADLVKQLKESDAGLTSLIDMKIKGGPKKSDGTVIIKNFFKDPLTRKVLDVQFQRVSMKEKIHVNVPIELEGDAPGVKEGGMLDQTLSELSVSCLPANIPPRITVDVSAVQIGDVIRAQDLTLGDEVEVLTDAESVVCSCRPPHVTVEAEVVAEAAAEGEAEAPAAAAEEAGEAEA